jgi:hypothetical protein
LGNYIQTLITTIIGAGEGPGIDVVGSVIGIGGDSILVYHTDGSPASEYPATDAGLDLALAAMASGDVLATPPCAFSAAHTLATVGLYDFRQSTFAGLLTLAAGVRVYGRRNAITSSGLVVGVYATAGDSWLFDSAIVVTSSDATAWAARVASGATLHVLGGSLSGTGAVEGKPGYSEGTLYVEDCDLYASSAPDYF